MFLDCRRKTNKMTNAVTNTENSIIRIFMLIGHIRLANPKFQKFCYTGKTNSFETTTVFEFYKFITKECCRGRHKRRPHKIPKH